jgi:hypothetical protein
MARLEVERKRPQIGERVAIAYHGLGQAQPGMQPPHRDRLIIDRQQTTAAPTTERPAEPADDDGDIPF